MEPPEPAIASPSRALYAQYMFQQDAYLREETAPVAVPDGRNGEVLSSRGSLCRLCSRPRTFIPVTLHSDKPPHLTVITAAFAILACYVLSWLSSKLSSVSCAYSITPTGAKSDIPGNNVPGHEAAMQGCVHVPLCPTITQESAIVPVSARKNSSLPPLCLNLTSPPLCHPMIPISN
jgi:hypothetical protein